MNKNVFRKSSYFRSKVVWVQSLQLLRTRSSLWFSSWTMKVLLGVEFLKLKGYS